MSDDPKLVQEMREKYNLGAHVSDELILEAMGYAEPFQEYDVAFLEYINTNKSREQFPGPMSMTEALGIVLDITKNAIKDMEEPEAADASSPKEMQTLVKVKLAFVMVNELLHDEETKRLYAFDQI